jgi:hypothetical protein
MSDNYKYLVSAQSLMYASGRVGGAADALINLWQWHSIEAHPHLQQKLHALLQELQELSADLSLASAVMLHERGEPTLLDTLSEAQRQQAIDKVMAWRTVQP